MRFRALLVGLITLLSCHAACAGVETRAWGEFEGSPVTLYTLKNASGMTVRVIDYGATLVGIDVPDRAGKVNDVTLGFDELDGYVKHRFIGSTVGRYCNRIANGLFTLDGKEYKLAVNNRPNHLHGGKRGFDTFVWKAEARDDKSGPSIRFSRTSPDGEEGYPGTLDVHFTYTLLANENTLRIDYAATTDRPTPVNLTNHTHFNLSGADRERIEPILDHVLTVEADTYTPFDATRIPTGEIAPVDGTPLDFRKPTAIGARIAQADGAKGGGYDHNFVIRRGDDDLQQIMPVALVSDPKSGRQMQVLSTEPGVQFFTDNGYNGTLKGKRGLAYPRHAGFCLETQHHPDSPNRPEFPSTILRPGDTYRSTTLYKFSVAP